MADTKIEWADRVWNPTSGCSPVSAGCEHCYAERMAKRLAGRCGYPPDDPFRVTVHDNKLEEPLKWRKNPGRVFVNSMSDLFHPDVPDEIIQQIFTTMGVSNATFLVLTKRPERMQKLLGNTVFQEAASYVESDYGGGHIAWPLPNVWLGVSVEDQSQEWRIRYLLNTPAARRFVSYEPALGPLELDNVCISGTREGDGEFINALSLEEWTEVEARAEMGEHFLPTLDWVIAGGETGPGARPAHPDWFRSLRDQCASADVPFFFKGWGDWLPGQNDPHPFQKIGLAHWQDGGWGARCLPRDADTRYVAWRSDGSATYGNQEPVGRYGEITAFALRVGKMRAGRLLDGYEYSEFPETR